jgi:DNA-binding PadR family transcriptional regulator
VEAGVAGELVLRDIFLDAGDGRTFVAGEPGNFVALVAGAGRRRLPTEERRNRPLEGDTAFPSLLPPVTLYRHTVYCPKEPGMPAPSSLSIPVYQILLSLAAADAHGYAVIRDVRERTNGEVELTASTLYGALQRMLDDGWIREVDRAQAGSDGPPRRVYGITDLGREVATAEARRLHRAATQALDVRLLDERGLTRRTP